MSRSPLRRSRIVVLVLAVAAAAEAAPLPTKPLPGPIGPAVPRPPAKVPDCLAATSDGTVGIGADATGTTTITPRDHDNCPSAVIVDYTIHPDSASGVALAVSDARESAVGDAYLVTSARNARACEEFKHTQKVYRRGQNDTAWTLAAEGTSTAQWETAVARCVVRRPNHAFRAQPPVAGQKVYYRTVDTLPNGPSGAVTVKWQHDRTTNTE